MWAGSYAPRTALFDAEGIPLGIAHDRPRPLGIGLRLDERCAQPGQALELHLALVRGQVEVERVRLRPRSLTALEEKARAAGRRLPHGVESVELALVHTRVAQQ